MALKPFQVKIAVSSCTAIAVATSTASALMAKGQGEVEESYVEPPEGKINQLPPSPRVIITAEIDTRVPDFKGPISAAAKAARKTTRATLTTKTTHFSRNIGTPIAENYGAPLVTAESKREDFFKVYKEIKDLNKNLELPPKSYANFNYYVRYMKDIVTQDLGGTITGCEQEGTENCSVTWKTVDRNDQERVQLQYVDLNVHMLAATYYADMFRKDISEDEPETVEPENTWKYWAKEVPKFTETFTKSFYGDYMVAVTKVKTGQKTNLESFVGKIGSFLNGGDISKAPHGFKTHLSNYSANINSILDSLSRSEDRENAWIITADLYRYTLNMYHHSNEMRNMLNESGGK